MRQQARRPRRAPARRRGGLRGVLLSYRLVIVGGLLALAGGAWLLWPLGRPTTFALPGPPQHLHGMAVDPHDSATLWVASHRGLVRYVDGAGWEQVGTDSDYMGFAPHPSERGVLYTSGHPGPGARLPNPVGLLVTRDGGRSWQNVSLAGQADFHLMAVSPADPRFIYGINASDGGLYRSEDEGSSWDNLGRLDLQVLSLAAHPSDARTVLAGTAAGLFRSQQGGAPGSWELLSPTLDRTTVSAVTLDPREPSTLYAFVAGPGQGLKRSRDAGASWERLGLALPDREMALFISVAPTNPSLLYVGTSHLNIFRSADGGATWTTLMDQGRAVSATRQ